MDICCTPQLDVSRARKAPRDFDQQVGQAALVPCLPSTGMCGIVFILNYVTAVKHFPSMYSILERSNPGITLHRDNSP